MKCQILFSGKNKKNISKCRLLKILPRVLSVNNTYGCWDYVHMGLIGVMLHLVLIRDLSGRYFCGVKSSVRLCTEKCHF